MRARDVMSHPVITVRADTTIRMAAELLTRHGFTGLPVTDDDDHLIGIVTEADLLRDRIAPDPRIRPRAHLPRVARVPIVADVMTTSVESLTAGADAAEIARIMLDERLRCLPIVDGRRIIGIVTRRDLLRKAVLHDDHDLAEEITHELNAFSGTDRWRVTVQAGVAGIEDHIDSAADRQIAVRLASAVPGVVGAQAHYLTSNSF